MQRIKDENYLIIYTLYNNFVKTFVSKYEQKHKL